jgi:serine phosphatase RsbU (regulator of sigma subunit)
MTPEKRCLGVIWITALDADAKFARQDVDLLSSITVQVTFAVEHSILHEAVVRDERMQTELQLAHDIQIGLLPQERPTLDRYEFYDYYEPARHVGGDYYEYLPLEDGRIAFMLGDVAGKGVPAALQMARISSELRVYVEAMAMEPVDVVNRINREFSRRTNINSFVTMVVGVLNPASDEITIINAGHPRPLLRRKSGAVETVGHQTGGPLLGVLPDAQYRACHCKLEQGETLIVFSDGITDAQNEVDIEFGAARLREALAALEGPPQQVGDALVRQIDDFVGDQRQVDDRCLLILQRNA